MGARKVFGPDLVKLIMERCVPVAIPGGNSRTIRTAGGKVLGAPKPGWNSNVRKGLAEFDRFPESAKRPKEVEPVRSHHIVRPPPPPGGLVLRLYLRGLTSDGRGGYRRDERQSRQYSGPQRDFLWMTAKEWKSLVPAAPRKGMRMPVPKGVACRLLRHLSGEIVTLNKGWALDHIRTHDLRLTVLEESPSSLLLRLEGTGSMAADEENPKTARRGRFRLLGTLEVDRRKKSFRRFDVVALGTYHNPHVTDYYVKVGQKKVLELGVAFELAAPGSLGYGSIPWALFGGWKRAPGERAIRGYFGTNPYPTR